MIIEVERELLEEMLRFASERHPNEAILILRGKTEKDRIEVNDYLFPPFASTDSGSARFPIHMLPIDFTIIGTMHSHPSGALSLSTVDMHNVYGRIMLLAAYPYRLEDVAAFNKNGDKIVLEVL